MYKRTKNGLLAIVLVVLLVVDISVDDFGAIWAFYRSLTLCSGLGTGEQRSWMLLASIN